MFNALTADLLDLQSNEMGTQPLLACGAGEVNFGGVGGVEICVVLASCSSSSGRMTLV